MNDEARTRDVIVALNAGSSSLKFAVFPLRNDSHALLRGAVTRREGVLTLSAQSRGTRVVPGESHADMLRAVLDTIEDRLPDARVHAVGHRVVHGGTVFDGPTLLNGTAIGQIEQLVPLAPLHQPHNLAGIRAARNAFPEAVQTASFDTAFHRTIAWENETFAVPTYLREWGVQRYGFHGLSYAFVSRTLSERGRLLPRTVIAHLGNGASLCAVRDGRSIATTMGMTPLDGLIMGTRPGRLDPGAVVHMMRTGAPDGGPLDADAIEVILSRECGLRALAGTNDMRDLEAAGTPEANRAIDLFCARIAEETAVMATAMGGLDQIVFTGGIGENSFRVRENVVARLNWLGVRLRPTVDSGEDTVDSGEDVDISERGTSVAIRVVPTNEEATIAHEARSLIEA